MKLFCVRTEGFKTVVELPTVEKYREYIDLLGDRLEWIWVEVKETVK